MSKLYRIGQKYWHIPMVERKSYRSEDITNSIATVLTKHRFKEANKNEEEPQRYIKQVGKYGEA